MPKGGKRNNAGRKPGKIKTATISFLVKPEIKKRAIAKAPKSLAEYITNLIVSDLNKQ